METVPEWYDVMMTSRQNLNEQFWAVHKSVNTVFSILWPDLFNEICGFWWRTQTGMYVMLNVKMFACWLSTCLCSEFQSVAKGSWSGFTIKIFHFCFNTLITQLALIFFLVFAVESEMAEMDNTPLCMNGWWRSTWNTLMAGTNSGRRPSQLPLLAKIQIQNFHLPWI